MKSVFLCKFRNFDLMYTSSYVDQIKEIQRFQDIVYIPNITIQGVFLKTFKKKTSYIVSLGVFLMMHCLRAIYFIVLVMFNIVETKGLLANEKSNNSDPIHGSSGHNVDTTDIMQMLLNQTAELENLKQQAENDRSTIQSLQNRVFFLEAELSKLNSSKPTQEMSTYLMSMNKLIQNVATNEENDRNLTQRVDSLVKHFDDLNVQVRYTSLSLLDVHSSTEQLNSSIIQLLEERISGVHDHIASMNDIYLNYEKCCRKFLRYG